MKKHVKEAHQCLTSFDSQSFAENLVKVDIQLHGRIKKCQLAGQLCVWSQRKTQKADFVYSYQGQVHDFPNNFHFYQIKHS